MAEFQHDRPHILLRDHGEAELYVSRQSGRSPVPPAREREEHARRLERELNAAFVAARQTVNVAVHRAPDAAPGYYLDFTIGAERKEFIRSLENRQQGIELVAVRTAEGGNDLHATVYVPFGAETYFRKKIEAYRTEDTPKGRPKNERLIASVDSVSLAVVQSIYTDPLERFPNHNEPIWWEIWLRQGTRDRFLNAN